MYQFISGISPVIVYLFVRILWLCVPPRLPKKGGPKLITLKLTAPPRPIERKSLCATCVYAHIVRGYTPGEELIFCGYSFPPREVLFPVRECSDYRANKEVHSLEAALTKT